MRIYPNIEFRRLLASFQHPFFYTSKLDTEFIRQVWPQSKATMVTVSFYEYTCSGDFCGCRCLRNLQYNPGCKYAIMVQVSKWIVYCKSGILLISNHSEYSIVVLKIRACDYISHCCSYYDLVFWTINLLDSTVEILVSIL